MLNPLKWKNEDQVGLLVATLAGAMFGVIAGGSSERRNMEGSTWLIWGLVGAVVVGGWVYSSRHHGRLKNSTALA